ncbi:hypothetical protein KV112_02360 [Mycolicibacter sp. MYC123]|uniref:Uncharacterized protein n=1 Tax=[Mycobacterium] zoologicum TaxID=2872311 RepID=A0ABU5YEV0_9MYCO|nr:hypothetical protein [Mycolicibacter sp. MYC123]MEB3048588.1 hypothetical protein [Mycolicibacter sp. MYC123]
MWCPSVSLSVWANAWLAGQAAPDDVLEALSAWAPAQSVYAYDSVAAGSSGLPWPDVTESGTTSLLQTLRTAAGGRTEPTISVVLPVPGDVRGLPAGTQFAQDAVAAGEAIVVSGPRGDAIGMVPEYDESEALSWIVYALPGVPAAEQHDLGDAEFSLRSAVRTAAEALGSAGSRWADYGVEDPRLQVEQMMEAFALHRIPDHAPTRAVRVLHSAAHVEAIITVSAELLTAGAQSSAAVQRAVDAVQPLSTVVRSARSAAVTAILHSAWRD